MPCLVGDIFKILLGMHVSWCIGHGVLNLHDVLHMVVQVLSHLVSVLALRTPVSCSAQHVLVCCLVLFTSNYLTLVCLYIYRPVVGFGVLVYFVLPITLPHPLVGSWFRYISYCCWG